MANRKKPIVVSQSANFEDQCVLVAWEEEPGMFCWDMQVLGPPSPDTKGHPVVDSILKSIAPGAVDFSLLQSYHAQGSTPNRWLILTELQRERDRLVEPFKSSKAIDWCFEQFKSTVVEQGHVK